MPTAMSLRKLPGQIIVTLTADACLEAHPLRRSTSRVDAICKRVGHPVLNRALLAKSKLLPVTTVRVVSLVCGGATDLVAAVYHGRVGIMLRQESAAIRLSCSSVSDAAIVNGDLVRSKRWHLTYSLMWL